MKKQTPEVLFSEEKIARRLAELGAEIGQFYGEREIAVVGLMKSCLIFMADLVRTIPLDLSVPLPAGRSHARGGRGNAGRRPTSSTPRPSPTRDGTSCSSTTSSTPGSP